MKRKYSDSAPMTEQLRQMEKGDILVVPAEKYANVNTYASRLGFQWDRKYSVRICRDKKLVEVIRKK